MNDLYLILHKVRGEPTFDIAQRVCQGEGTGRIGDGAAGMSGRILQTVYSKAYRRSEGTGRALYSNGMG